MGIKFSNNAVSRLTAAITNTATSITLLPGDGAKFPSLAGGDFFYITLADDLGGIEIAKATARAGDVLTVTRGQEGTVARAFVGGDRVELRMTAASVTQIYADNAALVAAAEAQLRSEITAGDTQVQNNLNTAQASLQSSITAQQGQIDSLGTRVTALEASSAAFPVGFGPVPWSRPNEPAGWIFCDGRTLLLNTPYTALRNAYIADSFPYGQDGSGNPKIPDMRGRVAAGKDNMGGTAANRLTSGGSGIAGTTLGASGGAETHTLTTAQMPSHTHTQSGNRSSTAGGAATIDVWRQIGGSVVAQTNTTNATGNDQAHNNTQPTLVTAYIVKT